MQWLGGTSSSRMAYNEDGLVIATKHANDKISGLCYTEFDETSQ
jgi:hypothetical protein